jgi:hypothetical protein
VSYLKWVLSICAKIIKLKKIKNLGRFPFCNGFVHLCQNNNNNNKNKINKQLGGSKDRPF